MNITNSKTMVFTNEYNGKIFYNASISNKKPDGTYENMSIQIQLPNGVILENKTKITIIKGFLTFYTKRDGTKVPKIVVQEFDSQQETQQQYFERKTPKVDDYQAFADDLPF